MLTNFKLFYLNCFNESDQLNSKQILFSFLFGFAVCIGVYFACSPFGFGVVIVVYIRTSTFRVDVTTYKKSNMSPCSVLFDELSSAAALLFLAVNRNGRVRSEIDKN